MPITCLRPRCCGPLMSATITASSPPVSRTGTSFVALLGLKGSRLYLLQDYKVAWVSDTRGLCFGPASRRLPDRAVEWAGALAQGEPRNDALLLLERMGFPNHACRVPGPRPTRRRRDAEPIAPPSRIARARPPARGKHDWGKPISLQ